MPTTNIPRLGEVEYYPNVLPKGIKGKTVVGLLDFPILVDERLEPGTKLDYVVAHEAGHRLTIDMAAEAIREVPGTFKLAPGFGAALAHIFIDHYGLQESGLLIRHPKTKANLHSIFVKTEHDEFLAEEDAREFVAEVFANWATTEGKVGDKLDAFFDRIIKKKHKGLLPTQTQLQEYRTGQTRGNPLNTPAHLGQSSMPDWYDPWAHLSQKGGDKS